MKLDFLLCGSPTPGFLSQMAFFKLSLNALGGIFEDARVVCVFGDHDVSTLPSVWRTYFDGIEVEWAHAPGAENPAHSLQHDRRFELIRVSADIAFLCDADVALLRPPDCLLHRLTTEPALAGVIAHLHFPWPGRRARNPDMDWPEIANAVIGKDIGRPYRYTLMPKDTPPAAPFYINYGMFAGPPVLMTEVHRRDIQLRPAVANVLGDWWAPQVSLALTVADLALPTIALPMRYNFPNDPRADEQYPQEMEHIVFLHYLRERSFKRDQVFVDEGSLKKFLDSGQVGSNEIFRRFVYELTGGIPPFPVPGDQRRPAF